MQHVAGSVHGNALLLCGGAELQGFAVWLLWWSMRTAIVIVCGTLGKGSPSTAGGIGSTVQSKVGSPPLSMLKCRSAMDAGGGLPLPAGRGGRTRSGGEAGSALSELAS
jgi:hypothetical protein